ncbi:HWE histidine kinase domain-containing protein [Roseibium aggregatum]|uniref:histidine kinase n=1 Tax=Roseibium aggregatum TaxID=187304 RepID=A0A939J4L9_9HYPH|nr:HWE histidine kinase domain-containing protein [Roseibium aggregatum]MBN9670844.1 GAF domain-containing protein [Roseibium aggregatum]
MSNQTSPEVDLTNCDREPIHLLGRVQSFGFLLGVTSDWIISHASENIGSFLPVPSSGSVLGLPVSTLLNDRALHAVRNRLQFLGARPGCEIATNVEVGENGRCYDISVHVSQQTIVLEFEPSLPLSSVSDEVIQVQNAVTRLGTARTVEETLQFTVRFVRALTGYDRVMAYRFLPDGSGEVAAEAVRSGMAAFLNLRYPASDIPKQARALYVRTPIRVIADVQDAGSPINPGNGGAGIDLSDAVLRSVSPIHLEYLRNMGVGASMSISLVVDNTLWGLIACHHNTPKLLSQSTRNALSLFGQILSLVLRERLATQDLHLEHATTELSNAISRVAGSEGGLGEILVSYSDELLKLMEADGMTLMLDGQIESVGSTPSNEEIVVVSRFLNRNPAGVIFSSSELGTQLPAAADFAERAAGLLAIPISKSPRDYIMFFRREVSKKVSWAGNPEKPVTFGPNGARLTPRKSFETWQQIVQGQSEEWLTSHHRAAEQLRLTILEVVLRFMEEASKERKRAGEKQELLIAELNHRVRNILSLVRSLLNQTQSDDVSTSEFARILDSRIQSLARAHDQITEENWSPASVRRLIETEAAGYLNDNAHRLKVTGDDVLLVPTAFSTVALVVHELITNSAKYGALSDRTGNVSIGFQRDADNSFVMTWEEIGGPPVKAPTRKGFGTTIIERTIPFELRGEAEVDFAVTGLRARFRIPEIHLKDAPRVVAVPAADRQPPETAADTEGFPQRVLLVEDNMIIAMDGEDALRRLGAQEVEIRGNVGAALQLLDTIKFDFALLDINLGSETSIPIAIELIAKNVPFIFASGYGENSTLPKEVRDIPVLSKPYDMEGIRAAWVGVSRIQGTGS